MIKVQADEALVMITPHSAVSKPNGAVSGARLLPGETQTYEGDYVRLTSKTGNIIVGQLGEEIGTGEIGWWKKMARFFSGNKDQA